MCAILLRANFFAPIKCIHTIIYHGSLFSFRCFLVLCFDCWLFPSGILLELEKLNSKLDVIPKVILCIHTELR